MQINRDRLVADLETLTSFSDGTPPGISRLVFADADQRSRAWLKSQCSEAGLAVREDAIGNMFARWVGARPQLAAIGTGSHIDDGRAAATGGHRHWLTYRRHSSLRQI